MSLDRFIRADLDAPAVFDELGVLVPRTVATSQAALAQSGAALRLEDAAEAALNPETWVLCAEAASANGEWVAAAEATAAFYGRDPPRNQVCCVYTRVRSCACVYICAH